MHKLNVRLIYKMQLVACGLFIVLMLWSLITMNIPLFYTLWRIIFITVACVMGYEGLLKPSWYYWRHDIMFQIIKREYIIWIAPILSGVVAWLLFYINHYRYAMVFSLVLVGAMFCAEQRVMTKIQSEIDKYDSGEFDLTNYQKLNIEQYGRIIVLNFPIAIFLIVGFMCIAMQNIMVGTLLFINYLMICRMVRDYSWIKSYFIIPIVIGVFNVIWLSILNFLELLIMTPDEYYAFWIACAMLGLISIYFLQNIKLLQSKRHFLDAYQINMNFIMSSHSVNISVN